jgi:hypothetical protein
VLASSRESLITIVFICNSASVLAYAEIPSEKGTTQKEVMLVADIKKRLIDYAACGG